MKKITKILLPLATVASTAAIAVPCITSCSRIGLMGTHDMLNSNYLHHVLPSSARTFGDKTQFANEYFNAVANYTDIIKDDILYTYSKLLTTDSYKTNLAYNFTRYFLYVDDIKVDTTAKTISMHLWAEVTASSKMTGGVLTNSLSKEVTGLTETRYVKNITAVIGAYVDASYEIVADQTTKQTVEPFKNIYTIGLKFNKTDVNKRVSIVGVADLAKDNKGTDLKSTVLNIDHTGKSGEEAATGTVSLFDALVGSISTDAFSTKTGTDLMIASYYFKNATIIK